MKFEPSELPEDSASLKEIIISDKAEISRLKEEIRLLRATLFGRKTQKLPPPGDGAEQLGLFNEAEEVLLKEEPSDKIEIPAHKRKKSGRKPIPEHLPRVEVVHDIAEEEKLCACGNQKVRIGEEASEQYDVIPAKVQVIKNIRPKYACRVCEGVEDEGKTVSIAPAPKHIIPKAIASARLIALVFTAKFVDANPFYRQEKQLARIGIHIPRATMCGWAVKVGEKCRPLIEILSNEIKAGPLINIDETRVQVMNEPGRENTTQSYMWAFRGGTKQKPILLYQYHPTREGKVASDFLRGYKGCAQTDGYAGYDFIDQHPDMEHAGCWQHVRSKFSDVVKAQGPKVKRKPGSADEALSRIQKLYVIENKIKADNLSVQETVEQRQAQAKPIIENFKKWLIKKQEQTPPKGLLGKAVAYALKQWPRLIKYLDNGNVGLDNNLIENAIRPFVVGRKNWLFSGSPAGAEASATLYTLIENAKANGLEPYGYLRYLFEKLPYAETEEEFRTLLPQYVDRAALEASAD